ncbi:MAG: hypothetical protein WBX01_16575 [Nitrososphaeraceae archaeon]
MNGKDEFLFKKSTLLSTGAGRDIIKQALLREKGYKQFSKYSRETEEQFQDFTKRYLLSIHKLIISDQNPSGSLRKFSEEIGSSEMVLDDSKIQDVMARISRPEILADRVERILNSNFVLMTFPVLNALFDGAAAYFQESISSEVRTTIIDGHIIAIDLSEPMDRIIDRDEDLDYLDDYKLMNPYILEVARQKISVGGDAVLRSFEEGFKDARVGQYIDLRLKAKPESVTDENMMGCYKKYRAIMGTAARNMALDRKPLGEIYHLGMAKASEAVGCGNEIQDAIRNGSIKIPSWPLYYSIITGDVQKAFELTMRKSSTYLDEAKIALDMLPHEYIYKPFLEFLFLYVNHYNQYWFNELNKRDLYALLQKNLTLNDLHRK